MHKGEGSNGEILRVSWKRGIERRKQWESSGETFILYYLFIIDFREEER